MSPGAILLLVLGLPLLLLVGLTIWLSERRDGIPAPLAWLAGRATTLWISFIVLMVTVLLIRLLQNRH